MDVCGGGGGGIVLTYGKRMHGIMSLATMKIGEEARIASIAGNDETRKRLETLGFVSGTPVRVLQIAAGNMILAVHESRVAIGRDVAMRIRMDSEVDRP